MASSRVKVTSMIEGFWGLGLGLGIFLRGGKFDKYSFGCLDLVGFFGYSKQSEDWYSNVRVFRPCSSILPDDKKIKFTRYDG